MAVGSGGSTTLGEEGFAGNGAVGVGTLALMYIICVNGIYPSRSCTMDPYLGEIRLFAGNFPPEGWVFCDGRLLSISEYSAVFSLLGTSFGGNGYTTFAVPDLRGKAPVSTSATLYTGDASDSLATGSNPEGPPHDAVGTLPLNYILCVEGCFPNRS